MDITHYSNYGDYFFVFANEKLQEQASVVIDDYSSFE